MDKAVNSLGDGATTAAIASADVGGGLGRCGLLADPIYSHRWGDGGRVQGIRDLTHLLVGSDCMFHPRELITQYRPALEVR